MYDFELPYNELKTALNKYRIIAIRGLRRTGKTTLMNVVFNELQKPKVFLDARCMRKKKSAIVQTLIQHAHKAITDAFLDRSVRSMISEIQIALGPLSTTLTFDQATHYFAQLDSVLAKKKARLRVFIDEAQLLNSAGLDEIIAHLFDNTSHIDIVVAGSEVGLIDKLLGNKSNKALFGRPKKIIDIEKLTQTQSYEFLTLGFKQAKKKVLPMQLSETVEKLDGTIGWLTLYGFYALDEGHDDALKKVVHEGATITAAELENFLSNRILAKKRYLRILEALTVPLRWTEVKRVLEASEGKPINDKTVTKYLQELVAYGFVIKQDNKYCVADPLLVEGVRLLTPTK